MRLSLIALSIIAGAGFGFTQIAQAQHVSANDFGGIGLLKTRTARFLPAGTVEVGGFANEPYRGAYALIQPFDWLEVNLRYTDITNVKDDGTVLSLGQVAFLDDLFGLQGSGVHDRGFDFKLRLAQEDGWRPAIAIGLQDIFGRARFGGEYVVASKSVGAVDVSLGIGWGYLGSRNHFGNPFSLFSNSFKRRTSDDGRGSFNFNDYFSGRELALFGGVEWYTPLNGLSIKAEYNSADPEFEPLGNRLDEDFPFNFGFSYRPSKWVDLAVGFLRGNTLSFRTSIRLDLLHLPAPSQTANDEKSGALSRPAPELSLDKGAVKRFRGLDLKLAEILAAHEIEGSSLEFAAHEAKLVFPGNYRLEASQRRDIATRLFDSLPSSLETLWFAKDGQLKSGWLMYQRGSDALRQAETVMELTTRFLAEDEADGISIEANEVIIEAGDRQFRSDVALLKPSAQILLNLPEDVSRVRIQSEIGSAVEYDLSALRALSHADRILGALSDANIFGSLRIESGRRARIIVEEGTVNEDAASLGGLTNILDVEQISILPAGYSKRAVFQDRVEQIFAAGQERGIDITALAYEDQTLFVWIGAVPYDLPYVQSIGQILRLLSHEASLGIRYITLIPQFGGADLYQVNFLTRDVQKLYEGRGSPAELWLTSRFDKIAPDIPGEDRFQARNNAIFPDLDFGLIPVLDHYIGNPEDGAWLADLSIDFAGALQLSTNFSIKGALRQRVAGNLDRIQSAGNENLPITRRDIASYYRRGGTSIPYLQFDYITGARPNLFTRLSVGIFERVFGGVSGEALYAPYDESWALGAELNWVKRRDPDQLFDFAERDTISGDVSAYWEWRGGWRSVLRVGRFLAGDWGASIDVSRQFENGVRLGAYMTATEDADKEFDGGGLDKGVYLRLPFSSFFAPYAAPQRQVEVQFRDFARDSGQRLNLHGRLYEMVAHRKKNQIVQDWIKINTDER